MSTVHLSGQLVCRDQAQAGVVAAYLPDHITRTRAERGCLSFFVVLTDDPLVWRVDERFEDSAAFTAHQERVATSDWGRVTAEIERRYVIDGISSRGEGSAPDGDEALVRRPAEPS